MNFARTIGEVTCVRCGNYTFQLFTCGKTVDICCVECGEGQGLVDIRPP